MRFSIIAITFLLSVLLFTHISQYAVVKKDIQEISQHNNVFEKVYAGYFTGWDIYGQKPYMIEDIYPIAHKLTHIIYAFAKPNPESCLCELQDSWADIGVSDKSHKKLSGNFAKLLLLKKRFPHLKILLSIGGGTYSKDIATIVNKGKWRQFIASCVALLDSYTYEYCDAKGVVQLPYDYQGLFDGIDFDWEWLKNSIPVHEAKMYPEMLRLCRKLLEQREQKTKKKQLLTVALQVNESVYKALNLSDMSRVVDWFNVMAYNFTTTLGSTVGFNAPIKNPWSFYSIDNTIKGLLKQNVLSHKIVLGIPLYGHAFEGADGKLGSKFKKSEQTGSLSYAKIKANYLNNADCEYKWHAVASVPYLYCSDDKIFISYDDEASIQAKIDYMKKHKLRGIAFWKLAADDNNHSLINVVE